MGEVGDVPGADDAALLSVALHPGPGDAVTVSLAGELDIASVSRVRAALVEAVAAGTGEVNVDLARLTFCDAAGIAVFIEAHQRLAAAGRRLRLQQVPGHIGETFGFAEAGWLLD